MKIVQFEKPGAPDVLKVVDVPLPQPGPGEIRVKAHAIGVGIPDILIRSGKYSWMPPLPCTPGTEMSGTVTATGADVANWKTGDKVYVSARERPQRGGCYAEEIVVRADEVYGIPDGADMEAVANLANYQVAWHLLHSVARVREGDTILVHAAAGGVGSAVVELGRIAGAKVIGACGGNEKVAFVRSLGAAEAIDRRREDVIERAKALTAGRGVDVIIDPIGGPKLTANAAALAPLGTVIVYGQLEGRNYGDVAAAIRDGFGHSIGFRAFSMHSFDDDKPRRAEATEALMAHLAKGALKPRIHARLPLSDAAKAHEMLEAGTVIGKVLLMP